MSGGLPAFNTSRMYCRIIIIVCPRGTHKNIVTVLTEHVSGSSAPNDNPIKNTSKKRTRTLVRTAGVVNARCFFFSSKLHNGYMSLG